MDEDGENQYRLTLTTTIQNYTHGYPRAYDIKVMDAGGQVVIAIARFTPTDQADQVTCEAPSN